MGKTKFITAEEAVGLLQDGQTLGTVGFRGMGHPEELVAALARRYAETKHPKGITLTFGASQSIGLGAKTDGPLGLNRLGEEGLVGKIIAGHWGLQPNLTKLAMENKIQAYNIPQGVLMHLYRAKGGNKPCVVTHIGLGTFADPREGGGKLNDITTEDLVERIEIDGKEYLMYKTFPIDLCFIRGTTADEDGNITMEHEGILLEHLILAYAAKASGGKVVCQVERVVKSGTLHPQAVRVPGVVVDYVVKCTDVEKYHRQCYDRVYDPSISGEVKIPLSSLEPAPLDERKVMCRRAALEMSPDIVGNLGMGIPETLGIVAVEEHISDIMTLTVEPGPIGGAPGKVETFGCSFNAQAMVDHPYQFDFYDGGGLDLAVLGLAELDQEGNINVSKFGPRIAGAGGFVNITQSAKKVVFCGAMTAGGLKVAVGDGRIQILQEGKVKKLIKKVGHKTFSGAYAQKRGQKVLYVTERAVFEMRPQGLTLIEIAPGVELKRDILDQMEFEPEIASELKLMDERIFRDGPMGIRDEILNKK